MSKAETFVRTERTLGRKPETTTNVLRVERDGKVLRLGIAIRREGLKRTTQEIATFTLLGPELKRFKKALRRYQ